jgi:hypothetical protein
MSQPWLIIVVARLVGVGVERVNVVGVVRWVSDVEPEEAWRPWVVAELALVLREEADDCGPLVVRRTDVSEFPYAARQRPPWPAHLVVAEVSVPPKDVDLGR